MRKNIHFSEASLFEVQGTSFFKGIVRASATNISKMLRYNVESAIVDNDKTNFEWDMKFGNIVFTIYDYCLEKKISKRTVAEYHIGTKCPEDTGIVVGLLMALGLDAYIEK